MDAGANSIAHWRLVSHQLHQPRWLRAERVVEWLGGVQAQDYSWAKWSIGLRMRRATDAAIDAAIAGGRIVRTWAFRGTLHFVAAADVSWIVPLLAPGIIASNTRRYRQLELDEATLMRSGELIRSRLAGGGRLVRSEIADYLELNGISAKGQRVPYILQRAALEGLICHGPRQGHEPAYVLLSEWIGAQRGPDRGEALPMLADRYFASHGPATARDFAWWAGVSLSSARKAVALARSVVRVMLDAREYWAAQERQPSPIRAMAHLLPPFDDYLLGYRDRSAALDPVHARKVNAGGGMPRPAITFNGEVVGVWKRSARDGSTFVIQELFSRLDEEKRAAVENAVHRYVGFAGRSEEGD